MTQASAVSTQQLWRYASVGLVTAAASLPLYMLVPHLYANEFGASLTAIGLLLMAIRLLDAWTDPWFGRRIDQTSSRRFERWMQPALILLTLGFWALVFPPSLVRDDQLLLVYLAVTTLLVSLSNGVVTVAHQAWPVQWVGLHPDQLRLVSAREFLSLVGVIAAAGLAAADARLGLLVLLSLSALGATLAIKGLPGQQASETGDPHKAAFETGPSGGVETEGRTESGASGASGVRGLLVMLTINALANAIPATLFLFFVTDYLQADRSTASALLVAYFLAALGSIPLWQGPLKRLGPDKTLMLSMAIGFASFIWVLLLPTDGLIWFGLICLLTGAALGAELICPGLLLAQRLRQDSTNPHRLGSGLAFGQWQLLAKCSLALAAGLCLPALAQLGYTPGDSQTSESLLWVYAGLPCLLKALAIGLQARQLQNASPLNKDPFHASS